MPESYHVVALTMAEVRSGGLQFQRDLGEARLNSKGLKVYSVSPFDLDERKKARDRFGGDIVYFFNPAAWAEVKARGLDLVPVGEISEDELPRRRSLVVGVPSPAG